MTCDEQRDNKISSIAGATLPDGLIQLNLASFANCICFCLLHNVVFVAALICYHFLYLLSFCQHLTFARLCVLQRENRISSLKSVVFPPSLSILGLVRFCFPIRLHA